MRRIAVLVGLLVVSGLFSAAPAVQAGAGSVAATDPLYAACGRVFSDPHAYWPSPQQAPSRSPWAKGNAACAATDFVSYAEMQSGMAYMEGLFPQFIEFYSLEDDFGDGSDCATSTSFLDFCSAGIPQIGTPTARERSDLYMVRVTDERVPETGKKYFVFPLSIHGIERAGAEAGVRAAEDLATWAYCEAVLAGTLAANGKTNCAREGAMPHPLLEAQPDVSLTAGETLQRTALYFVFANPDGWRRGDPDNLVRYFQRYNGNGVDMNRDWPTIGFTHRPYTPWSEPETRAFGKVLKQVRPQWDGGIDLHGQLIDRAFSFTLMGASERDYGKDQRILQVTKGAWADAEARLAWSPHIKPNDAPDQCSSTLDAPDCDERMWGVQWGTVWDTINYTVTGAFGDWIDSPLGLNGDGLDNEMSLSHLSNCGVGSCYLTDFEQMHVDGNKSLVYSMVNFSLLPEDQHFEVPGKVGYIHNPKVAANPGNLVTPPPTAGLPPQAPILNVALTPANNFRYQFVVQGPDDGVYNGGLEGKITSVNVQGPGPGNTITSAILERKADDGEPPVGEDAGCGSAGDDWEEVNRFFNQGVGYFATGQAVHANLVPPGDWRICMTGSALTGIGAGAYFDLDITFGTEKAWEDPGQLPYSVTNMKFFSDLAKYTDPGQIVKVTVPNVLSGKTKLEQFTSVVLADDPFPGGLPSQVATWAGKLRSFVEGGGNLVLTDRALQALEQMGVVAAGKVVTYKDYAGFIGFTADGGNTDTYDDPLATNVNQPGAAEGSGHRHQTYEPVPIGMDIGARSSCSGPTCTAPIWGVDKAAWETAGGRTVGTAGSNRVVFGELPLGAGRVRIIGALLPFPTEEYYHPFGLANYAITYTGYQVFKNTLQWTRPTAKCPGYEASSLKQVVGTNGDDQLVGDAGAEILCGLGGNDEIIGGSGNDLLLGGLGVDELKGGFGDDDLIGGAANDSLNGGQGTDRCEGGDGADTYRRCEQQLP